MTTTGTPPSDRELVRLACSLALADEPGGGFALADVERRGRRIVARRRVGRGAAGLAVAASVAVAAGVWAGRPASVPSAVGPTADAPGTPPVEGPTPVLTDGVPGTPSGREPTAGPSPADPGSGIGVATGFPLADALAAVAGALPAGVRLADADPGGWERGDGTVAEVDVPLDLDGSVLTARLALAPTCWLHGAAPLLGDAQAAAVAKAVCDAWSRVGRPDPLATGPAPTTDPVPVDPAA